MIAFTHYSIDSRVRREAEALVSRGDEVDCICCHEEALKKKRNLNGVRLFQLPVTKYRGGSTVSYLFSYLSFFVQAAFLVTFLQFKKKYHIVQVHTMPDFLVFATLIPKALGAKIILDVHDLMPELYMSKFEVNEKHLLTKFIKWIEQRSIAFAHEAIAVHIPHRDILVKHGNPKEKFTIVLNLADPKVFGRVENIQRITDGKFRLIYHGTIAKRHGLDIAIRAVALAKKNIHNIEFSIIGAGDDCERLIGIVDEMGLENCVRLTNGSVLLEEIPQRIMQADVAIVPVLRDPFTRYQLPVKVLEYIWLGIPVISSRSDTLEFYFDKKMIRYFNPGDESELANHILDLHDNPEKREHLVANAKRFNEKFSWDSQKIAYYKLIDSLCFNTESQSAHSTS